MSNRQDVVISTPYGATSSPIIVGQVSGIKIAFLARHDVGHRLLPSEIPYRANFYALKLLGVKYVLSLSACGSLREELAPCDVVLVDQFVDRTKSRADTFFGNGVVAHPAMAEPVCPNFRAVLRQALTAVPKPPKVHDTGIYVCMEGPAFSTKAESEFYRFAYKGSVIGMTACPEYKLAKEAEMAYAVVAMVTDYDCWHSSHESVSVEMVMANLKKNGDLAQQVVLQIAKLFASGGAPASSAHSAMKFAVMTPRTAINDARYAELRPILQKYMPA